jgi:hypothetical protein
MFISVELVNEFRAFREAESSLKRPIGPYHIHSYTPYLSDIHFNIILI